MNVVFVEARSFTRRWPDYLTEEELREFEDLSKDEYKLLKKVVERW
jgi:hypothetical protein